MAKIFIENATLLDCAALFPQRGPEGRSWYVDIFWEGHKDEHGVLVDFGIAKRIAKSTIDHEFDHKLLVKKSQIQMSSNTRTIVGEFYGPSFSQFFGLNIYNAGIKKISTQTLDALESGDVSLLEKDIAQDILRNSPKNVSHIRVKLREHEQVNAPYYYRYTHSLCHHTGNCQRFHGHGNTVHVYHKGIFDPQKSAQMATLLNHRYLISSTHITPPEHISPLAHEILSFFPDLPRSDIATVEYTGTQGPVALLISRGGITSLKEESTVENLCEYIRAQFPENEDIEVHTYEGLQKGCIFP
jgi:6-pyruvoyl-tetrahydropterin synthase